jgi:hypothetical protein
MNVYFLEKEAYKLNCAKRTNDNGKVMCIQINFRFETHLNLFLYTVCITEIFLLLLLSLIFALSWT